MAKFGSRKRYLIPAEGRKTEFLFIGNVCFSEEPPPELVEKSQISQPFYYMDMKMAIPVLGTFVTILVVVCTAFICLKRSKNLFPFNRLHSSLKYYAWNNTKACVSTIKMCF